MLLCCLPEVCFFDGVQAVVDVLERPYYQRLMAGEQAPGRARQGLRCATALRRLLHPASLLPKQAQVPACHTLYPATKRVQWFCSSL